MAISATNKFIASSSTGQMVKLWTVDKTWGIRQMPGHSGPVKTIIISQDSKYIVSGSSDRTIKIWDPKTGVEIRTLQGHNGTVLCLAATSDF